MPNPLPAQFSGDDGEFRNPAVDCPCGSPAKISSSIAASRRRGFTLIELLVAISIIALLLGIGAVGAMTAMRHSQRTKVKAMFESLQGAQSSYQAAIGTRIDHTIGVAGTSSNERFVLACLQHPDSESTMRSATNAKGALSDRDGDGNLEIIDPWDTPILYLISNNQDGTLIDGVSNTYLPISRDPFFVSAGPDQDFATTDDNITSIEIGS